MAICKTCNQVGGAHWNWCSFEKERKEKAMTENGNIKVTIITESPEGTSTLVIPVADRVVSNQAIRPNVDGRGYFVDPEIVDVTITLEAVIDRKNGIHMTNTFEPKRRSKEEIEADMEAIRKDFTQKNTKLHQELTDLIRSKK